jgi:hypothetical protein
MRNWLLLWLALPAVAALRVQFHLAHLQPSDGKLNVREIFLLEGDGAGSVSFFVPKAGQGSLRVTSQRGEGQPVNLVPQRVSRDGVYVLNLPAAPGGGRIDVTYSVALVEEGAFSGKDLCPGIPLRLVVPGGFALEGEGIEALGQEGQATIYGVQGADYQVRIREAEPADEGPPIQQILPRAYDHLAWILAPALVVLLAGFLRYYFRRAAARGERRR